MYITLLILIAIGYVCTFALYMIEVQRRKFWYKQYIFFKDLCSKSLDELHTTNQDFEKTVKQLNNLKHEFAAEIALKHKSINYEQSN